MTKKNDNVSKEINMNNKNYENSGSDDNLYSNKGDNDEVSEEEQSNKLTHKKKFKKNVKNLNKPSNLDNDNNNKFNSSKDDMDDEEEEEEDDEDDEEVLDQKKAKKNKNLQLDLSKKNELLEELKEKEQIYLALKKNTDEIESKYKLTNEKYNKILKRVEDKKSNDLKYKLNELEKEIEAYRTENKNFKKSIDQMKNSVYFKDTIKNATYLQNILQQEKIKNKELSLQLSSLKRVEKSNINYVRDYEESHKIKEHINLAIKEIKETKEEIKKINEDYNLLEKYFKLIHEKVCGMEIELNKKKNEGKDKQTSEEKKMFNVQEVKDILQLIVNLRNQIMNKRNRLNNITSESEDKMNNFYIKNKKIEDEIKEGLKLYKDLMNKKQALKKDISNMNTKLGNMENKIKLFNKSNNNVLITSVANKNKDINGQTTIMNNNNSKEDFKNTIKNSHHKFSYPGI